MSSATQISIAFPAKASFREEDYLCTSHNQHIFDEITAWPHWGLPMARLEGPKGSGKSHLGTIWANRAEAKVIEADDLPETLFTLIDAPQNILLEDVDRNTDEEALFHLYNIQKNSAKSLLITSVKSLAEWQLSLPDLQSRMATLPVFKIAEPDDMLCRMLITKLLTDRQMMIEPEVVDYLLPRMQRSYGDIHHLVATLDHQSLAEKRKITIPLARQVLEKISD